MDIRLTLATRDREADVLVTAPDGTTLGAIAARLHKAASAAGLASTMDGAVTFAVSGQRLAPGQVLGVAPLLRGARVWLDGPGTAHEPDGPRQLRVVCGPDAGGVHTLRGGEVVIGRSSAADVRLCDPDASREHAVVDARPDGVWVRDAGSTNGTWLDSVEIGTEPVPLAPGALLRCGDSLLLHTPPTDPPAAIRPDGAGGLGLHRPPRLRPRPAPIEVVFPDPPPERPRARFPWVLVVAPLLIGGVLWFATGGNSSYLLLMLLSPLMFGANALSDRFTGRREHRRAVAEHQAAVERTAGEREAALDAETTRRRAEAPDPAALLLTVLGPGSRLWERRGTDDDALVLRLGTADLPSRLTVRGAPGSTVRPRRRWQARWWARNHGAAGAGTAGAGAGVGAAGAGDCGEPAGDGTAGGARRGDAHPTVRSVPVTVPLREVGVLGIAGPCVERRRLARWLIAQLASLHAPRDLRLALLTGSVASGWGWFCWLPHTAPLDGRAGRVSQGVGPAQVAARVAELTSLLESRQRAGATTGLAGEASVVLVLDGADRLRTVPGVARLLSEGPPVGILALCLAGDALELPEECGATVVVAEKSNPRLRVTTTGSALLSDVTADLVGSAWTDRLARGLAPIRDTTPSAADGSLPTRVRLRDLMPPAGDTPAGIAAGWRGTPRSTRTVLGTGMEGPVSVDLRDDGPHALVAGTTGAGKSELLQTLIAGLALANRPDELTFILVDYKGGAAFADCARLPHTAGMVTDLDARLTARALDSLGAELRRREHLLAEAGTKDLEAYQLRGGDRLARLVIVIDEFASLVAELPDFVTGLVDIARRGRSLGVHLVLATQRPAGVVSAEIRANTTLRICLRVVDSAESTDVLDAPDAASISQRTPGRAYARLAGGTLTAVQTARVGGSPPTPHDTEPDVVLSPWRTLGEPHEAEAPQGDHAAPTDLAQLVDAVATAAELAGVPPPPSPWLPPLPELVTVTDLTPAGDQPGHLIPLGLHDLPAEQRRAVYSLDLAAGGHLMLAGSARSGRTSALRAVGAGIGVLPVTDVHLYALDCGGGGLACLEALPHCGAVVPRDDTARGQRLLDRLGAELARRQDALSRAGFGSIAEQRAAVPAAERMPWLILLLDSWEGFLHAYEGIDHGRLTDHLTRLLREGPAGGLRAVVTGDRGLLTARAATLIPDRLVLRMPDPDSYGLAGIPPRDAPARPPAGRALVCGGDTVTEVQLALLDHDPAGPAQLAAVARIAAAAHAREHAGAAAGERAGSGQESGAGAGAGAGHARGHRVRRHQLPMRLRPLPATVTLAELTVSAPARTGTLLLGAGGDDAAPVGLDLTSDGPGALVAGPSGSGRSTALHTAAVHHVLGGGSVAVVGGRRSAVTELAGAPGVLGTFAAHDGDALLHAVAGGQGPVLVVVDDADQLLDTSVDAAISRILSDGRHGVLVAGVAADLLALYRGCTVDVRRSRCGLLLCPSGPQDGELLGVTLSRRQDTRPGRGVLVRRGTITQIQTAQAAPAAAGGRGARAGQPMCG